MCSNEDPVQPIKKERERDPRELPYPFCHIHCSNNRQTKPSSNIWLCVSLQGEPGPCLKPVLFPPPTFWWRHTAYGILVPQPGIEPTLSSVLIWTPREVPAQLFLLTLSPLPCIPSLS